MCSDCSHVCVYILYSSIIIISHCFYEFLGPSKEGDLIPKIDQGQRNILFFTQL